MERIGLIVFEGSKQDRLLLCKQIIQPADVLLAVFRKAECVIRESVRARERRNGKKLECRGRKLVGRNDVARIRPVLRIDELDRGPRKIAVPFRRRECFGTAGAGGRTNPQLLKASEYKQAILDDRASQRKSGLVSL